MASESQRGACKRYQQKMASLLLRFRKDKDADVIERLSVVPNKTEFIRQLVRRDIRENTNEQ